MRHQARTMVGDGESPLGRHGLAERVLDLLAAERSFHGHGSAAVIDHKLGKAEGYVGRLLRRDVGLQIDVLGQLLDVMEVDPADFFTRAVGTRLVPARVLRRVERKNPMGEGRPLLDRAELTQLERWVAGLPPIFGEGGAVKTETKGQGQGQGQGDDTEWLRLEERLFSEPEAGALEIRRLFVKRWEAACLQGTVSADERAELGRLLGLLGSAERLRQSLHESAICLRLALELLAGAGRDDVPMAEILLLSLDEPVAALPGGGDRPPQPGPRRADRRAGPGAAAPDPAHGRA